MLKLPNLNREELDKESFFDVDALPDMDEKSENAFIDILEERRKLSEVKKKDELKLPKEIATFKEAYYKKEGNVLTLHFKLEQSDIQNMAKVTYGLFSTDVNTGSYEFQMIATEDAKVTELYYYNEFSGEIIDGAVKIYKRYFFTAIVRSLVQQEILFEHETNKFTINPIFFIKLQIHSASIAKELSRRGFPIVDVAEYEKMKSFEVEINNPTTSKEKDQETEDKKANLF